MSCSLDKTKSLAKKEGIINNFNELVNDSPKTISKFGRFSKYIKDLAISKFGALPEGVTKPMQLDGKKVVFNQPFFDFVDNSNKYYSLKPQNEVEFTLKSVSILNSPKADEIFRKGDKNNWSLDKMLQELQVPKEQQELIKSFNTRNRADIITSLLANYSYTVEINTAKDNKSNPYTNWKEFEFNGDLYRIVYENDDDFNSPIYTVNGKEISYDEYIAASELGSTKEINTQYYSNLTVPGFKPGSYKELRFITPLITPSIRGHAQFAQDNDIGWSRVADTDPKTKYTDKEGNVFTINNGLIVFEKQSDLFQKGRDKESLTYFYFENEQIQTYRDNIKLFKEKGYIELAERRQKELDEILNQDDKLNKNQFLQLLNKDSNWVTFFIKSIIQDSAKKGYEKVLFPSGNTASKVEGHTTLEEFKRQKENRLQQLEEEIKDTPSFKDIREIFYYSWEMGGDGEFREPTQEQVDNYVKSTKEKYVLEKEQLKQELQRVETEGFGALKPIYNFYENQVKNILKKNYNVKEVTDEYGNTWNEVELSEKDLGNILLSKKKSEVERILTEGDVQLRNLVQNIPTQIDKTKAPQVVAKMKEILDVLGIKMEISNLPEEVAAQADILNQLIQFSDDSITEDNFTEETIHFIVEVLEQKDKALYSKLASQIWKYPIYTQVLNEYGNLPEYQINGRRDINKLKKEAIGQLLTAQLLDTEQIQDPKGFVSSVWETISNFIKDLFYSLPLLQRDEFQELANQILRNPNLIEQSDVQYLGQNNILFARKTKNKLQSSLAKAKRVFGSQSSNKFNEFETLEQAFIYFQDLDKKITKVVEKEINPETGLEEDVEYYLFDGNKKQRVTTVIKEANNKTFSNISQDERAQALREAKKQKGTEVHKTIEDILKRYIDETTGVLRTTPIDAPLNTEIPKAYYQKLENHVQNRLNSYPKGTRFMMETKVVNEEQGYAGTIDFLAFIPKTDGYFDVDILDWKTTDVSYWEAGQKRKRFDISPFNQTYWKTQLSFYKRALESHGIENFRYTRAIPIALETKQTLVDKSKKATPDNVIYQITNLEVGDSNPKFIKKEQFYLTPVAVSDESTGNKELDKLIEKLQGIYKRIQASTYKKEEAYKKKQELDRISQAIREIQIKKSEVMFTTIFAENFQRFRPLADKKFDFLNDVAGKRLLPKEQEDELHSYLNEVYSAIEFLDAFNDFPTIIATLFEEGELSEYEKEIKQNVIRLEANAKKIASDIEENAINVIDQLGQLYDIDQTSALDNNNLSKFSGFISILHRDEGSIQFAARLINVIKFLGEQESKQFFDQESGEFTTIFKSLQEWRKTNKKSLDETNSLLLNKDKEGKPVRELLAKIKTEYFEELSKKQEEFTSLFTGLQNTLSDLGYKGTKYRQELTKDYKNEVLPWLKANFNLTEYDKQYLEALNKYKESTKDVQLDEDDLINEEKKAKRLQSWINDHDIYSSPTALSTRNYILYNTLNESKWYSEGYKNLLKPENKALLDAYNLFTKLNKRAEDNGMLEDFFNSKRFVPNVLDPSLSRSILETLKSGAKSPFYIISKVKEFIYKHLGFVTDIGATEDKYDPLTGKPLKRIPVKYRFVPEGKEQDLSNDLFYIYSLWADHIIKYEMLSNYENRFKMLQLLESLKDKSNALDSAGHIVRKKDDSGQPTLQFQETTKSKSIEDDLNKIINNYVYSSKLDIKPEYYKLANALYDYTALKLLGLNVFASAVNLTGGTISARLLDGKWFDKSDITSFATSIILGTVNKNLSKYGENIRAKSQFLIQNLDTRISNEYDTQFAKQFKKGIDTSGAAFALFRWGDHAISDSIAISIFLNTTIKDGKFVNINDLVKAKYNPIIFNTSLSNKERNEARIKRDKEIQELKEKANLFTFLEGKDKFKFKGIDVNSLEGKAQILNYQNIIGHYIKQALGNSDEFDKSINGMDWYWKFVFQFKRWMPRLIGARIQNIEYQYELGDYHYGKSAVFLDAFRTNFSTLLKEFSKSLLKTLPYVPKDINSISAIDLAKGAYKRKQVEAFAKNQTFDLSEDEFTDIYLNQLRKSFDLIKTLSLLGLSISFVAASASGDDDNKWFWRVMSRYFFGLNRELTFDTSPEQLISFFSKGIIPVLSTMTDIVSLLETYINEIRGDIGQKLPEIPLLNDPAKAEERSKKAKPISKTIKATPFLNQLHYWLAATSEDYADYLEIEQPKTDLEQ